MLFLHNDKTVMVNTRGSEDTDELKEIVSSAIVTVSQAEQLTSGQDLSEMMDPNADVTQTVNATNAAEVTQCSSLPEESAHVPHISTINVDEVRSLIDDNCMSGMTPQMHNGKFPLHL